MTRTLLLSTLAFSTALGCAANTPSERVLPDLDAKADFAAGVEVKGEIEWDTPVEGTLSRDLEYHAYTFEAAAGSAVSLEVTHRGTSSSLATVLLLYGPPDGDGERARVAHDYDSGWGPHSELSGVELEATGVYTAVVGAADQVSRGTYSLVLGCDSTDVACVPDSAPLELTEGEPNTEFMETFNNIESEYCWGWGRAFSYSEDRESPALEAAAAAIMELAVAENEIDTETDEVEYRGEVSRWAFEGWLDDTWGYDIGVWESAIGPITQDPHRIGEVVYAYGCAPSVTCSASIMVALFPETHEVWTLEYGCGDE